MSRWIIISIGIVALGLGLWAILSRKSNTTTPPATNISTSIVKLTGPFSDGQAIPKKYSCQGDNISPELRLSTIPPATKYLAVIMEDESTGGPYVHWLSWNILRAPILPEGQSSGVVGNNSAGKSGYTGPCPTRGTHTYRFDVYGFRQPLELSKTASAATVRAALKKTALFKATLRGTFSE